jgi:hypothetical protein
MPAAFIDLRGLHGGALRAAPVLQTCRPRPAAARHLTSASPETHGDHVLLGFRHVLLIRSLARLMMSRARQGHGRLGKGGFAGAPGAPP